MFIYLFVWTKALDKEVGTNMKRKGANDYLKEILTKENGFYGFSFIFVVSSFVHSFVWTNALDKEVREFAS